MKSYVVYLGKFRCISILAETFDRVRDMMDILDIKYNYILKDTEYNRIKLIDNFCKN